MSFHLPFPHNKKIQLTLLPMSLLCSKTVLCKLVCWGWGSEGEMDTDCYITAKGQQSSLQHGGPSKNVPTWAAELPTHLKADTFK